MADEALILRADANEKIGSGHVMRCLALAQAYSEPGRRALFATDGSVPALEGRLREGNVEILTLDAVAGSLEDAERLAELAHRVNAKWIVVDGYQFGSAYQETIKSKSLNLLVLDDYGHAGKYFADIVVNQNIHADESLYRNREPYTKLLLGTRYALLRKEFLDYQGWERGIPEVAGKVLVTLGGADPPNVTLKVILGLKGSYWDALQVVVVIGEKNSHYRELVTAIEDVDFGIDLKRNVRSMSELMAWADVAISGAGSTCWEMAFMGLPSVVIALADNQRLVAESLVAQGVATSLGWYEEFRGEEVCQILSGLVKDRKKREDMGRNGRKLVDGGGANRVARLLRNDEIRLRLVREDDCRMLWNWANDDDVRGASFSSEQITWEHHIEWFKSKTSDRDCLIFVAVDKQGLSIGQVRFERKEDGAQISISVEKALRDKGYGRRIIELASEKVFEMFDVHRIDCYIKIENENSKRAFTNAGYKEIGLKTINGQSAVHLQRSRQQ